MPRIAAPKLTCWLKLRDESGATLAASKAASEFQVDETFDDLVSVKDAVIEGFALPADGVYALYAAAGRCRDGHGAIGSDEPITAGI